MWYQDWVDIYDWVFFVLLSRYIGYLILSWIDVIKIREGKEQYVIWIGVDEEDDVSDN